MPGRETLGELALRKKALILESELNRLTLQAEYQKVRAGIKGWGAGNQSGWWWLLAPVAGFFAVHMLRRPDSLLHRVVSLLKWLPPVWTIWKNFCNGSMPKGPTAR
jgi:hypothetical protein